MVSNGMGGMGGMKLDCLERGHPLIVGGRLSCWCIFLRHDSQIVVLLKSERHPEVWIRVEGCCETGSGIYSLQPRSRIQAAAVAGI